MRHYHEHEGGIEYSFRIITVWYHKACLVMANGDLGTRSLLSHPHTRINSFFLALFYIPHLYSLKSSQMFLNTPGFDII